MIAISYQIRLHEPLLMTQIEGDPNGKKSLAYLPGSVLRGAVMVAYARSKKLNDLPADPTAQRLFFDGSIRFLNAYPIEKDRGRTLPTPRSWRKEKGKELSESKSITIYDFAAEDYADSLPATEDEQPKQWKPIGHPFYTPSFEDTPTTKFNKPEERIQIHTTRNRHMGRATEEDGEVFRYQALETGQIFAGCVLCDDHADAPMIESWLPCITLLGGARNAGYGTVEVRADQIEMFDPNIIWRELELDFPEEGETRLLVTLLSDAIIRDSNGQACVSLDALESVFRDVIPDVRMVALMPSDVEGESNVVPPQNAAFFDKGLCGGFNRKWGLPLPQCPVFAMGSRFLIESSEWTSEQIDALEWEGIGERRTEGFGRIAITLPPFGEIEECYLGKRAKWIVNTPLAPENRKFAQGMVDRLLLHQLDRKVLTASALYTVDKCPKPNQIARLRSVLRSELLKEREAIGLEPVGEFMKELQPHARRQYQKAIVKAGTRRRTLEDWVRVVCAEASDLNRNFVTETLGFEMQDALTNLGGERASLLTPDDNKCVGSVQIEYALKFLDAVLARAVKQAERADTEAREQPIQQGGGYNGTE